MTPEKAAEKMHEACATQCRMMAGQALARKDHVRKEAFIAAEKAIRALSVEEILGG